MERSLLLLITTGVFVALLPSSKHALPAADGDRRGKYEDNASYHVDARPAETRLRRSSGGRFFVDALVNGQPVRLVVDTGATGVALTVADAQRIGVIISPREFTIVGSGASGPVRGQAVTLDRVSVDGKEVANVRAAVVEGLEISLLGQSYLTRAGVVQMKADEMTIR